MIESAKLYMSCPFQEKMGDFSTQKTISEDEYVKMLREYSSTIGKSEPSNRILNRYGVYDIKNVQQQENEEKLSSANIFVYDMSGKKCSGDDICNIKKNGMTVLIFEIPENNMEESFEDEYKFWKQDSMKINNDKQLGQDDRIKFLPIKEFQLEMGYYLFKLEGCKLYHDYNDGKVALIVQKITEI